jgi:enoyl-CoA hydratase/carnithine racemase
MRLAAEDARLGFVFSRLGIVPEACSSWFLPRIVGLQQALEWTLTGDIFSAQAGQAAGLIRSVHAPEALLSAAQDLARRCALHKSPVAVALTRRMMRGNSALPHPLDAHRIDSLAMFYTSQGDGREGVAAFLEKRAPAFTGRASAMPSFFPWDED